jgi:hypothetical protein
MLDASAGAAATETGAPIADVAAASAPRVAWVSVMTSTEAATARAAAATAAAHPHGKAMLGPIAAIVAWNSLMMSM